MVALEERTDGTDDISVFDKIRTNKLASQVDGTDLIVDEDFAMAEGKNILTGTTTGSRFSTTASQKIAFHGSTPIVQAVLATGSTNDQIITALQNLGLVKQS